MNPYEAIKIAALRVALKPDSEYFIRKVSRWFSTTYHTPISQVYDMPIEEVLQAFFEAKYEAMDEDQLQEELVSVIETEEQRKERLLAEDFDKMTEHELFQMSEQANKNKPKRKLSDIDIAKDKTINNKLPGKLNELTKTLKDVAESIKKEMESDPAKLPPDIEMTFESDEAFSKLLESDGSGNSNKE